MRGVELGAALQPYRTMHGGALARHPPHGSVKRRRAHAGLSRRSEPAAYVVYPDTRSGEEVSILQITAREDG
jgi:hypothetical protein